VLVETCLCHARRVSRRCAAPRCPAIAISTSKTDGVWCVCVVAWREACSRIEFCTSWEGRDRAAGTSRVAINLSRSGP
jgi:hypothetical protein